MNGTLAAELALPEWLGGLALGAWAALGLVLLVLLLARLADARAAAAAAVVYVTARLYHVDARAPSLVPFPLDLHAPALAWCGRPGDAATPPTFDRVLADLGHDWFPYSALVPFALASLIEPPPPARHAECALRLFLLTGATLSTALGGLAHHCGEQVPFAGALFVAGALGLWLRDLSRGARVSGAALTCIGVITALLALDFVRIPVKRGVPLGLGSNAGNVADRALAHPHAEALFIAAATLTLVGAAVAWLAGAVDRAAPWRRHVQGPALFIGGLLGALVVQLGYYRGLAARLSPGSAFQTYEDRAGPADALALLGVTAQDAARAHVQPSFVTSDARAALDWLTSGNSAGRRFIALGSEQLPRLNANFRALHPRRNLPILDARSTRILLAVDRLAPGERSDNPLDPLLLDQLPADLRPLDAELGGRVRVWGWQLLDDDGQPIGSVPAGTPFELRVYYEMREGNVDRHCTFLHIDHRPARFSAEHGDWREYPLSLWRRGDLIVDTYPVELPRHFGPGAYPVYFGFGVLPCRDDRRLKVTRGAHDHDRVHAGTLTVR